MRESVNKDLARQRMLSNVTQTKSAISNFEAQISILMNLSIKILLLSRRFSF